MLENVHFTASDQHGFDGTLHLASDSAAPVLVFFSALGTPAKVYRHFGHDMARLGVHVCTPDWRGIGSSSMRAGRGSDFGYRQLVEMDMPCVLAALRERFPLSPIWLGGHSLGGQLSLLCAAAQPEAVSGVLLIASGTVHMPCYPLKMRLGIGMLVGLSGIVSPVLGYFPGSRVGFGGREGKGVMRDWSHVALSGHYQPRGSQRDYEQLLSRLACPVLALGFAADTWSPASATLGLLAKLPANGHEHWHWSAADTEGHALDHYSWLRQPALLAPRLAQYLQAKTA